MCREYFADEATRNHDHVVTPIVLGGDNDQCKVAPVQQLATKIQLIMNLIVGLLSAVIAPKLGQLSDMYGRTRWLALSSAGGLVSEIVFILAAEFPDTINYRWIILGAVFDGLSGSFTAGNILSHSYTSDCTSPTKRGVAIGYIHACLFAGLALGPVLAGYFVATTGSLVSIFYVALGCHAIFVLFALLVMPESVSRRRQLLAREKHAKAMAERIHDGSWLMTLRHRNPFAPLQILYRKKPGAPPLFRRNVISLAIIDMVLMGAAMGAGPCIIMYTRLVFGWQTLESSKYVSTVSTVRAFVLLGVFPVINYVFRTRPAARRRRTLGGGGPVVERNKGADGLDIWLIRVALVSDVLGATGYLVARSPALFVVGGMVTAVGSLGSATIQASLTKHVPPDTVGQLLGAVGLLHALARVLSPLAFSGVYWATLATFPQAIFVLLVGLFGLSLLGSLLVRPHGELSSKTPGRLQNPLHIPCMACRGLMNQELTIIMQSISAMTMRARRRGRGRKGDRPGKRSGYCDVLPHCFSSFPCTCLAVIGDETAWRLGQRGSSPGIHGSTELHIRTSYQGQRYNRDKWFQTDGVIQTTSGPGPIVCGPAYITRLYRV